MKATRVVIVPITNGLAPDSRGFLVTLTVPPPPPVIPPPSVMEHQFVLMNLESLMTFLDDIEFVVV